MSESPYRVSYKQTEPLQRWLNVSRVVSRQITMSSFAIGMGECTRIAVQGCATRAMPKMQRKRRSCAQSEAGKTFETPARSGDG